MIGRRGLVVLLFLSAVVRVTGSAEPVAKLPAKDKFHVFVLAGQSNMAGRGKVEPGDLEPHPRVLMLTRDLRWVPAADPLHFDKPRVVGVGLGRSFAIEIARANPEITVGLVPCAVGGSPIDSWEPGGYHRQTRSHPWDDSVPRIRSALAVGTLKGILWHQGESDSRPPLAGVYRGKLNAVIARFRRECGSTTIPFIAGQMGRFPDRPWNEAKRQVDASHRGLPKQVKHTAFVSAEGLTHKGDGVHFDSKSYRELGRRYARAWFRTAHSEQVGAAGNRPRTNVVLVMADDVGYECFGCYGSRQYRTPHIDRLAAGGMRFRHCYSQPLCTPSRVKLMTGMSNVRNYSAFSILNRDQRTIGQYFREAGYRTAVAGKWQLLGAAHYSPRFRGKGTWPHQAGFDRACLWQVDQFGSRFWKPLLHVEDRNRTFGPDDYGPDVVTSWTLEFIEKNRDRPFFLYFPMIQVHSPFVPTPDSASRQSKKRQRNFEDMVAFMDSQVGRIVDKLKELGLTERTLVLFVGDNGTHRSIRSRLGNRTIRGGKAGTTDAGTRVPLVAAWPGTIPAGRVSDDLVDFSDFLPTVLEATGINVPDGLDGRSFLPQLQGRPGNPRQWVYCYYCPRPERTKPVRFARDQRWKLYGDGRFYDITRDVLELNPLEDPAGSPEASAAHGKLSRALASMPARGQSLLKFGTAASGSGSGR